MIILKLNYVEMFKNGELKIMKILKIRRYIYKIQQTISVRDSDGQLKVM